MNDVDVQLKQVDEEMRALQTKRARLLAHKAAVFGSQWQRQLAETVQDVERTLGQLEVTRLTAKEAKEAYFAAWQAKPLVEDGEEEPPASTEERMYYHLQHYLETNTMTVAALEAFKVFANHADEAAGK